jgi:hypothetical protein
VWEPWQEKIMLLQQNGLCPLAQSSAVTVVMVSTRRCQRGYGQLGFQQTYPFLQSVDISPQVRFYILDVVCKGNVVCVRTL